MPQPRSPPTLDRPPESLHQVHIPGHERDTLGVQRAEVRIGEQAHQVRLGGFLQALDGRPLPPKLGAQGMPCDENFTHQSSEGSPADEEVGGALVPPDFLQDYGARLVFPGSRLLALCMLGYGR